MVWGKLINKRILLVIEYMWCNSIILFKIYFKSYNSILHECVIIIPKSNINFFYRSQCIELYLVISAYNFPNITHLVAYLLIHYTITQIYSWYSCIVGSSWESVTWSGTILYCAEACAVSINCIRSGIWHTKPVITVMMLPCHAIVSRRLMEQGIIL